MIRCGVCGNQNVFCTCPPIITGCDLPRLAVPASALLKAAARYLEATWDADVNVLVMHTNGCESDDDACKIDAAEIEAARKALQEAMRNMSVKC